MEADGADRLFSRPFFQYSIRTTLKTGSWGLPWFLGFHWAERVSDAETFRMEFKISAGVHVLCCFAPVSISSLEVREHSVTWVVAGLWSNPAVTSNPTTLRLQMPLTHFAPVPTRLEQDLGHLKLDCHDA